MAIIHFDESRTVSIVTDVINIVRQKSVYVIRDKQAETGGARWYKCYINGEKEHVMWIWYDWLCNHDGFIEFNYKDKANPEKKNCYRHE